jgi:hypothetical protein
VALDMALKFDLFQLIFHIPTQFVSFSATTFPSLRPLKIFFSHGHEVFPFFSIISALFVFCLSRFDVKKHFRIPHVADLRFCCPR